MMATSYKAARYAGTTVDYNRMAESLHFGTFKGHAEQLQALEKKLVDELVAALKEQRYLEASKGDDTTKHVHYDLLNDADTALQGSNQLLAPMNQIMGSSSKRDELHDPLVASTGSDKPRPRFKSSAAIYSKVDVLSTPYALSLPLTIPLALES
ncbi:hypothetical protein F443_05203 [Phytophthora nicotianae P1569]|uniref:Uncharacterized protein n=1 Tax=Phytophthora nicotianae P1569 TaxID=1317065 RepID=V9FJ03_PHYNI|nr:hypothetical protein F443_05203 [Phytophthora nicotianae P1569]